MNYKERFIGVIGDFKKKQKDLRAESDKFAAASVEGEANEELAKVDKQYKMELKNLKTDLTGVLDDKRTEIIGKPITDKDYPVRLKNLETVLIRDGADMSEPMLDKALVLFKEDPVALNTIRRALLKSGRDRDQVLQLIAADDRDATINALDDIEAAMAANLKIGLDEDGDEFLGYQTALAGLDDNFNTIG